MSRKAKRRKMAIEEDEREHATRPTAAAIRLAKKSNLPKKITESVVPVARKGKPSSKPKPKGSGGGGQSKLPAVGSKKGHSAFDDDRRGASAGRTSRHEGMRAKRVKVDLKKGGKGGKGKKGRK
jgi:hypothetical protein